MRIEGLKTLSRCLTEMFGGDWFIECHCVAGWFITRYSISSGYHLIAGGDTLPVAISNTLTAMINSGD